MSYSHQSLEGMLEGWDERDELLATCLSPAVELDGTSFHLMNNLQQEPPRRKAAGSHEQLSECAKKGVAG